MNEIIVNRTDRRTDKLKVNPFFKRKSDYSVSSPKTPRMQKRHKEMEKELLETPKVIESNSLEITVTAEDVGDIKKPLQGLLELFQIRKDIQLFIEEINENYRHYIDGMRDEEYYTFDIKMLEGIYVDWMENNEIDNDLYFSVLAEILTSFADNLKMNYDWIEDWNVGGRSGGWLVLHPDTPWISRSEEFIKESFEEDDDIDTSNVYQENIDDMIKEGKMILSAMKRLSIDMGKIEDSVKEDKAELTKQMETKDFWRAHGMNIPEEPSPETERWKERWHRRSSMNKKSDSQMELPMGLPSQYDGMNIKHIEYNRGHGLKVSKKEFDKYLDAIKSGIQNSDEDGIVNFTGMPYGKIRRIIEKYMELSEKYYGEALDKGKQKNRTNFIGQHFLTMKEKKEQREKAIEEQEAYDLKKQKIEEDESKGIMNLWNRKRQGLEKEAILNKKAKTTYYYGNKKEDISVPNSAGLITRYTVYKVDHEGRYSADAEDKARIKAQENGDTLTGGSTIEIDKGSYREYDIIDANDVTPEQLGQHQEEQRVQEEESTRTRYHHQGQNPVAVYDESDYYDDQIEYIKENILEKDFIYCSDEEIMAIAEKYVNSELDNVKGFWNNIEEAGKTEELIKLIEETVQTDSDMFSAYAEQFIDDFSMAMADVSGGNTWLVRGQDMGWMNQSGEEEIEAKDAQEFMDKVFPRTSDFTARVWKHKSEDAEIEGLYIRVSHHDSPMGESYYAMPIESKSERDEKTRKWEERWHRRGELTVILDENQTVEPDYKKPVGRAIDRLQPISNLWYENEKGVKLFPDISEGLPDDYMQNGFSYQHSRFPVLRDTICTDEGVIMSGETSINCIEPIVIYLVQELGWKMTDAITVGATTCERCLNILLEETTGEPYLDRDKAGTHCELCAIIDPEYEREWNLQQSMSEEYVQPETKETMVKESSVHNDIIWKALKLAFKFNRADDNRFPEFQSNTYVIFTQDAKFQMDQLDAMGEIKKNMVGKVKKVKDDSLSIEIGKQIYEVPLIDAFKVMEPFTAQIVISPENSSDISQEMPSKELMPDDVSEEIPEEQPEEASPVRPGVSMEREDMRPVPIKTPQKPAEKALSVETVLKNVMKRIGRTLTYKEEILPKGTKINISISGENVSGTVYDRVQGGYQVIMDDGRKLIIPEEMITDVADKPIKPIDPPVSVVEETKDIPVESEVWVVLDRNQPVPTMSRGDVVGKDNGMYRIKLHTGEIIDVAEQDVRLEKLPDPKKKMPFTPYRYSKRGLFPTYSIDSVQPRALVYVATKGYYTLGRVISKGADTLKIDLIDGTSNDYGISEVFLTEMPPEMRSQMMQKYTDWTSEAIVITDGFEKQAEYENMTVQTSDIPEELKKRIKKVQDDIDKDILYTGEDEDGWVEGGLQKLFHTTILYGVNPKDKDAISERINEILETEKLTASTADIEYFDNEEKGYSAMVLRIESPGLKVLHDMLKEEFDNEDDYPEYKTHVTIAYLKPNERVEGIEFAPLEWEIDGIEITNKDGSMTKIAKELWHKRSDKGVVDMERVILGSVEISDQMLDKDGLWISRELWEPEISYRVEQIEMSLGQIERGVNVTAQIRSFIDDLDEILEKIPNDQLTSAQDYISEQLAQKPDIQSAIKQYFNKTADDDNVADNPIKELNKVIKKKDEEVIRMQNPEEKGRMREPSNPQTVQQDVNIDARNSTPLAGISLRKRNKEISSKSNSEFTAIEADIKSGFRQLINEIETSNNPYVVNDIGRRLFKQQQSEKEIVREGNVSRILL